MTTFYAVHNDQKQVWIAARENTGQQRILVWVANDNTWRRNLGLEEDYYAFDRDMSFQEISPDDVVQQLPGWPKLKRTTAGWLLDDLQSEPSVSSEELGLPAARSKRSTKHLADELEAKPGQWVYVETFPGTRQDAAQRARVRASEIRTGKKASLRFLGFVEARTRTTDDGILVEAMHDPARSGTTAEQRNTVA